MLVFQISNALLDFADIVTHVIDCATDMMQVLKNDVVELNHNAQPITEMIRCECMAMFFPKIDVKDDPVRRWHRPDRQFFANGACQVLAYAFLEKYHGLGFRARWIKPAAGHTGNHIFVTDGLNAFDYHGLTTEALLLSLTFRRARRFFPCWNATLVDLPTDVLVSELRSRQIEGLWLREPTQFLHDALPRARAFVGKFGDLRSRLVISSD